MNTQCLLILKSPDSDMYFLEEFKQLREVTTYWIQQRPYSERALFEWATRCRVHKSADNILVMNGNSHDPKKNSVTVFKLQSIISAGGACNDATSILKTPSCFSNMYHGSSGLE